MQIAASNQAKPTAHSALSAANRGGWAEVVVLGAYAAQLALLIGERGSIAGIILATIAAGFWWHGFGRDQMTADPIAIGNAAGIMAGLAIGFPQLLIPAIVTVPVVLIAGSRRMWQQGQRRSFAWLALTVIIAAAGSGWLAINLHLLPR